MSQAQPPVKVPWELSYPSSWFLCLSVPGGEPGAMRSHHMERGSEFPAPCSRRHARSLTSRRPQACCLMPAGGIQPWSVWGGKLLSITDLILEKASWSRNRLGSTAKITSNILHSNLYFLSFPLFPVLSLQIFHPTGSWYSYICVSDFTLYHTDSS